MENPIFNFITQIMPKSVAEEKSNASVKSSDSSAKFLLENDDLMKQMVKDGFTIGKLINHGSYGNVYLANHSTHGKLAAKALDLRHTNLTRLEHFQHEIEALSVLKHKNIILMIKYYYKEGIKAFVFLEYAPGQSVVDVLLETKKPFEAKVVRSWTVQICDALKYMHEKHWCHHDLKTDNVLLLGQNLEIAKLCDFGHTERTRDAKTGAELKSKNYIGSVPYLPPEIFLKKPYDGKPFDVWSLGICVYVMLFNEFPFDDSDHDKMYNDQITQNVKFEDDAAKEFIMQMLQPDVKLRADINKVAEHSWLKQGGSSRSLWGSLFRKQSPFRKS